MKKIKLSKRARYRDYIARLKTDPVKWARFVAKRKAYDKSRHSTEEGREKARIMKRRWYKERGGKELERLRHMKEPMRQHLKQKYKRRYERICADPELKAEYLARNRERYHKRKARMVLSRGDGDKGERSK